MRTSILCVALLGLTACATSTHDRKMEGVALLEQGKANEAQAYLDANGDTDDPATQLVRAQAAQEAGDYETAITVYRNELKRALRPGVEQFALVNLAAALRAVGQTDEAYSTMQRLERLRPNSEEVQRVMGALAMEQGQIELARLHFGRLGPEGRESVMNEVGGDFFAVDSQ
ncbi:MAG: tetratricopeptide repeat protein [Planctomycetota bacterium]